MHQRLRRRPVARRLARIVFSPRPSFTPALPPAELQRWYEAHAAFYALLHSDECCVTVKLAHMLQCIFLLTKKYEQQPNRVLISAAPANAPCLASLD